MCTCEIGMVNYELDDFILYIYIPTFLLQYHEV